MSRTTLAFSSASAALFLVVPVLAETPVPRSVSGDVGRVYLLHAERRGTIVKALHKRVHDGDTVYAQTEFDCEWRLMRTLGYSRSSPGDIKETKGTWYFLESGSARSDLAAYVCR